MGLTVGVLLIAAVIAGATGIFCAVTPFDRLSRYRITHRGLLSLFIALSVIGGLLVAIQGPKLETAYAIRTWEKHDGVVLEAEMTGRKAFIPTVTFSYDVEGILHTHTRELYAPQFGSKETRKRISFDLLDEYSPGKRITVYVNPSNSKEAELQIPASWQFVIQFGVGIFLLFGTLPFLTIAVGYRLKFTEITENM